MKPCHALALLSLVLLTPAGQNLAVAETPKAPEKQMARPSSVQPGRNLKDADMPAYAKLSFEEAMKAALAARPGKVISGELGQEQGGLVYTFTIVGKDRMLHELQIDAGNGQLLALDSGSDD